MNKMGERIKELRTEKGWTLKELAERIGVGFSTVRKWENGMIENVKRDKVVKLAEVFGVDVKYLLGIDEDMTGSKQAAEDLELLKKYHSLTDSQKEAVMNVIDTLLCK